MLLVNNYRASVGVSVVFGALLFGAGASAAAATVTPSSASVPASSALSVSWDRQGTPTSTDWIGLYRVGDPSTGTRQWWSYVTTATGSKSLTSPATTGTYEFRYFSQNTYTLLATSAPVTVTASTATFTLTPSSTSVGTSGALSVSWSMTGRTPTSTDWIGLFLTSVPDTGTRSWWQYTGGLASGTKTLTAPATAGTYEFRLFAQNTYTRLATSAPVTVGGGAALTITTSSLPGGTVAQSYNATLLASGGTSPYGWSLTSGTLPAGLGLSPSGAISGTPTAAGSPSLTFRVTDSVSATATRTLTLSIAAAPVPTATLSANPLTISSGQSSTLTWSSTNATSCASGGGFTTTGATSGTATVSPTSTTTYTLTCTGPGGTSPVRSVTVTVSVPMPLTIPTTSLLSGTVGRTYSSGVSATGGVGAYSFSITSGTLPAGLTFSAGGALFGIPAESGSFTLTFRVIDGASNVATRTLTLTIVPAPAPTVTLSANPLNIANGQSSALTWSSTDATGCTASGGWSGAKTAAGSQTVSPPATTTYSLSCTGAGGTSPVQSVTVTVGGPTTFTLTPSVTSVGLGGALSVSWSMTGRAPTSTDWIGLFWTGDPDTGTRYWWQYTGGLASGTKTLTAPTTANTYEFRLFAQNTYTRLATSAPITVGGPPVATATLNANPLTIGAGQSSTLTWSSTNATGCVSTAGGWTTGGAISGTQVVSPATTTTYSLTCTGAGGTSPVRSVTVTVNPRLTPVHNLSTGTEVYNYANLAWGRYFNAADNRWVQTFGMDFGACPLLDARRLVNNTQVAQDLDALAQRGVQGVRWWVIPDGRNLIFNTTRTATGRGAGFRDDLWRALDLLSARNMGVIITLIDGNTWFKVEGLFQGAKFGHAQSIINVTKRQALYNTVIIPILQDLAAWAAAHPGVPFPVTAIDLMNEPYYGSSLGQAPGQQTGATMAHMQTYAREAAALVRLHLPGVPVTVGEARAGVMVSHWTDAALGVASGAGLDLFSFHHFGTEPLEGAGSLRAQYGLNQLGKRVYLQEFPTKTPPLGSPAAYLAATGGTRSGRTAQGYLSGSYPWSFTAAGDPWTADDPLPVLNEIQSWYALAFDQPDLTVGPINIPILQNGTTTQFVVPVVNQGGAPAGASRFELWIDGTLHHALTLPALAPGEFMTVTAPAWPATTGGHNLWAKADVFLQVNEPNEMNNERAVPFTVFAGPLPDLIVSSVTMSPNPASIGQSVTFTVQVQNIGTTASASNRLEAWRDGSMVAALTVPAMTPQVTTTFTLPAWTATAGTHDLWTKADIFEQVNELNESNNERNTTFFVQ